MFLVNCSEGRNTKSSIIPSIDNEQDYAINLEFEKGDARRYGVFPEVTNTRINERTGKSVIVSLLDLAETNDIKIYFETGDYPHDLNLKSRKNLDLVFNDVSFNALVISGTTINKSENIKLAGSIKLYDRLGVYQAQNIWIQDVIITSNFTKNLGKLRSRGCHIYKGAINVKIDYLKIEDLGSGESKAYENSHAALVIDGMGENPIGVSIKKLLILSSDIHGAYITGENHSIDSLTIKAYGQGETSFMSKMQEAKPGHEKIVSGAWINRCNGCSFKSMTIITRNSPLGFPLKLDKGRLDRPTIIEHLILDQKYTDTLIVDEINSNIILKKISIVKN